MKDKRSITVLATVLVAALLSACSKEESSTGPTTPPNYFPLAVGNWWVYTGIELDTSGAEIPGTEWRDSSVVVAQTTIAGRQGYVMVSYSTRTGGTDTMMVASEGGRLYVYSEGWTGDGIPAPSGWIKYADPAAATWSIWDTTLTNVRLDSNLTTSGTFSWRGERGGTMSVTVKGRQVTAQEFRVRVTYNGKLYMGGMEVGTVTFTMVRRLWAAEGIGIVRSQNDPTELTIQSALPGGGMTQKSRGERTILVDYSVR